MTLIDKTEALLPCPFCGGEAVATPGPIPNRWGTSCLECDCWLDIRAATQADAIASWNRRALPARGVGVKPLVWEESDTTPDYWVGKPAIGKEYVVYDYPVHGLVWFNRGVVGRHFASSFDAAKAAAQADYEARVLAALAPTDAAQARPAWLSNCVVCGRIVDTRETDEGGDGHGCEYAEGWTCSSDCAERLHPDPDWMKEGLAAQAREAALREAAAWAMNHVSTLPMDEATQSEFMRHRAALPTEERK